MLEKLLKQANNWFTATENGMPVMREGVFSIENGSLALDFLKRGQYFRIQGSTFNDGLHEYPCSDMVDEDFTGTVTALAIPQSVIELSERIAAWCEANASQLSSPYESESFGGYSYKTRGGWARAFSDEISRIKRPS